MLANLLDPLMFKPPLFDLFSNIRFYLFKNYNLYLFNTDYNYISEIILIISEIHYIYRVL